MDYTIIVAATASDPGVTELPGAVHRLRHGLRYPEDAERSDISRRPQAVLVSRRSRPAPPRLVPEYSPMAQPVYGAR